MGRICKTFPGNSLFDCLNMTRGQLLGLYWESFRVEARERLRDINNTKLANAVEPGDAINNIEMQAYPFDPEEDGDFGKDDIRQLMKVLK